MLLNKTLTNKLTSSISLKAVTSKLSKQLSTTSNNDVKPNFGLLFDIDGVLVRGKKLLPNTKKCFKLITDTNGKFKVPTIFVTNAGNELRSSKAAKLSNLLGVNIDPDQVVMSHSPLRMMKQFHNKRCLISGQGPVVDIAKNLGFKNLVTIDELRQQHPQLDVVDHKRRTYAPCVMGRYSPDIEVICLFGESIRWETNLQLIIDVLMCKGRLNGQAPKQFPIPNLPILVCNCDFIWMAEASMPRFGHGTFLYCLEQIYQKLSGQELKYSAIVGKPSEITYYYAEKMLMKHAKSIGIQNNIKRLYAVGDNLDTDIYGANIYNQILENNMIKKESKQKVMKRKEANLANNTGSTPIAIDEEETIEIETIDTSKKFEANFETKAESISSILVRTGVFQDDPNNISKSFNVNLEHKDTLVDSSLIKPKYVTQDVFEAVEMIFQIEKY